MELVTYQHSDYHLAKTYRLIPSKFPTEGLFDDVCSHDELDLIFAVEGLTNDRLVAEAGDILRVPKEKWVYGRKNASVIMAAFCHASHLGGRFTTSEFGAWYAGFCEDTAIIETKNLFWSIIVDKRLKTLVMDYRQYIASFRGNVVDISEEIKNPDFAEIYSLESHVASQKFAKRVYNIDGDAIVYSSVRKQGGKCIAVYNPRCINNCEQSYHYKFLYDGNKIITEKYKKTVVIITPIVEKK